MEKLFKIFIKYDKDIYKEKMYSFSKDQKRLKLTWKIFGFNEIDYSQSLGIKEAWGLIY